MDKLSGKHTFTVNMPQPGESEIQRIFSIMYGQGSFGFKKAAKMAVEKYFALEDFNAAQPPDEPLRNN